jgi:hypothetical protein
VQQTYEAIEASANWLNRDQKDVEQVSEATPKACQELDIDYTVVEGQQVPLKVYLNEQMKSMHAGILIHISVYRFYKTRRLFRSMVLP